jgi:flavin reductase (DIM6/NTAB) family NADH-FMN oxidoreductase RutF
MPTTLVGATVDGKPNFLTIAPVGIATPGSITLGMGKTHFSYAGICEHGVFSVNILSVELLEKTDCCGLFRAGRPSRHRDSASSSESSTTPRL